ncbi:hypothetical protein [Haloferax sp. DFSO52]|uniref:DUF7530 family protein n=1 Tax=Haloferax sp. DFSO52 TaxID=3388505 RepID=UPI003A84E42B
MSDAPNYGETWVYESIVGALPGVNFGERGAIALQIAIFETAVLFFAWVYDLWTAALAGTAAIVVAAVGSVVMLRMGERTRAAAVPTPYRRLLFGSSIEVVLGILAFVALVTHLFVFDPRQSTTPLVTVLFGPDPPIVVVYLMLLILWDLCYRIGTSWWAAVVGLWGALRYRFDEPTAREMRRVNLLNVGFGVTQVLLVPFILDQPILLLAVSGHVVAVTVVSVTAAALIRT